MIAMFSLLQNKNKNMCDVLQFNYLPTYFKVFCWKIAIGWALRF